MPPPTRNFHRGAVRDLVGEGSVPNNISGADNTPLKRVDGGNLNPGAQSNFADPAELGSQRPPGRGHEFGQHAMHKGFFGGPLDLRPLKLSDEQKQKIRDIHGLTGGKARELRQTLRARRMEMRDLMFDPDATAIQIRTKHKEVRQLQDKMDEMLVEDFIAIRTILTPEQRQLLPEVKPKPPDFPGPGRFEPNPTRQKNPAGEGANSIR